MTNHSRKCDNGRIDSEKP